VVEDFASLFEISVNGRSNFRDADCERDYVACLTKRKEVSDSSSGAFAF
jgi:hypothetical protein